MPITPLINGINYAWANVTLILFGVPVVGITKIDYNRKQKKENNYGAGQNPVSRGYGNVENDCSIEIYMDELKRIIAASPGRDILKIKPFDIQVTFGGDGVEPTKDVLRSCEFLEDPFSGGQGDQKLMAKLPIIVASIEK